MRGQNVTSLGLTGKETYGVTGISTQLAPHKELTMTARGDGGKETNFQVECRIDSEVELDYYRAGGVLHYVLRKMLGGLAL
jgi:aconitate hydratase A / 2-methylisocitrate dehydratase